MTEKIISMPTGFNPSEWSRKTNCYMYAINYRKDSKPRDVGELSGNLIKDYYTIDEIQERLFKDMKMLNMEIKKATYEDECLENEWKIALFYREEDGDFHFLREDYHNRWLDLGQVFRHIFLRIFINYSSFAGAVDINIKEMYLSSEKWTIL